jgi:hypothetical protein
LKIWPICEILGFQDNRDQSIDFQRLRESDFTGLIEKRPSASAANRPRFPETPTPEKVGQ